MDLAAKLELSLIDQLPLRHIGNGDLDYLIKQATDSARSLAVETAVEKGGISPAATAVAARPKRTPLRPPVWVAERGA